MNRDKVVFKVAKDRLGLDMLKYTVKDDQKYVVPIVVVQLKSALEEAYDLGVESTKYAKKKLDNIPLAILAVLEKLYSPETIVAMTPKEMFDKYCRHCIVNGIQEQEIWYDSVKNLVDAFDEEGNLKTG